MGLLPPDPEFRLSKERVTARGEAPARWILFLHGILGSGSNWKSFARRLVRKRPEWGACLVNLRQHAESQGAPPPHTIEACARDLRLLEVEFPGAIEAVSGHSFGSKVALAFAAHRRDGGRAPLRRLWLLDGDPAPGRDAAPSKVDRVFRALAALPPRFPRRQAFESALVGRGFSEPLAAWLGKNLRRDRDGFRLQLDLPSVTELLEDYRRTSGWEWLEGEPADEVHVVLGDASDVVPEGSRRRLASLAAAGTLVLHHLEGAGHWLHIDEPKGLERIFLSALDSVP